MRRLVWGYTGRKRIWAHFLVACHIYVTRHDKMGLTSYDSFYISLSLFSLYVTVRTCLSVCAINSDQQ